MFHPASECMGRVEATDTEGLCEHHPEHTAECGYAPAEPGQPCTFVCEICNSQEGGEPADKPQPDEDECVCTGALHGGSG